MDWNNLLCSDRVRPSKKKEYDLRTEFEKDYHRIINSASFRRLQDKTQVFPLDSSDFVRTRLTHSLEVSSIGKSLEQNISKKLIESDIIDPIDYPDFESDFSNILACAGLIHDIGNPPFGHYGEDVIQNWFINNLDNLLFSNGLEKPIPITKILNEKMIHDLQFYEGNAQALRLLTKLHFLVDANGMNLTKALLNTIVKYPVNSISTGLNDDIKYKKFGYFNSEEALFHDIGTSCGTLSDDRESRHPLTFLLEAADDIAYMTADLEDGYKKGLFNYSQLFRELSSLKEIQGKLTWYYEKAEKNEYFNPEAYAVQNIFVYIQGKLIGTTTDAFFNNYEELMAGSLEKELMSVSKLPEIAKIMKGLAVKYLFNSTTITSVEISANSILSFLLDHFIHAVIYYDTANAKEMMTGTDKRFFSFISENYIFAYKQHSKEKPESEKLYLRLMLVCDYICGMTDSYAKNLYQTLTGMR